MKGLRLDRPWLVMDLGMPHRVLSWAVTRPGYVTARRILWREVRDADLSPDLEVMPWLAAELAAHGLSDAVAMLTSRDIGARETASATVDGVTAECVATVGLSNAERIGTRRDHVGAGWGTINIAVKISQALADPALAEALSIVAQARTAAVMETGHRLPAGIATGTGTDCIAVAAPPGALPYAGMHTATGEAVGRAVHAATSAGARAWVEMERRNAACL